MEETQALDAFASGITSAIHGKLRAGSFASLTPLERVVFLLSECSYRLVRSGFTSPLLEATVEERDATLAALSEVGATNAERLLRAAGALYDAVPEHLAATCDLDDLAGREQLRDLENEFERCDAQSEIDGKLFHYILKHREALCSGPAPLRRDRGR